MSQRQDHLDDAGDARGGLQVADVGLDRPQQQGPLALLAVGGEDGLRLDGIAQLGSGAVRLHDVHIGRCQSGVGECRPDHPLLGRAVRRGETVRGAVGVDGRAAQQGQDLVAVAPCVGQPLQHQDADTLAPARAVGGVRERLAPAVAREPPLSGELVPDGRRGEQQHARAEGQVALAVAQRLHGQVQRDQRRRARRVNGERRPLQAEDVGDAAGEHTGRDAGDAVPVVEFG